MSMRRQLYEWQINRQTNGYPLANPTDGTTFEQIAGIPVSIFTGGIGNNITMPAATTATQFVAIDNMRCSPSFFLSGAGVMAVFNTAASAFVDTTGFPAASTDVATNLTGSFNINTSGTIAQVLPAPDGNTGTGTGAQFTLSATGVASPNATAQLAVRNGSGYAAGDVITWNAATVSGSSASITGTTGATLDYIVKAVDLATYANVASVPFTGAQPNPVYTPSAVNPELTFQTTHVNPFTSIAGPMMFMQLLINTTSYFNETDGTVGPGLPGTASPCPETAACRSTFEFESPVYILPGQQWDVQVTVYNDSRGIIGDSTTTYNYSASDPSLTVTPEDLCCLVQYTLYDGPDALIATKLVEMGIAVRPENVDWYKRQLLEGTI
jgi:hypothetical protein